MLKIGCTLQLFNIISLKFASVLQISVPQSPRLLERLAREQHQLLLLLPKGLWISEAHAEALWVIHRFVLADHRDDHSTLRSGSGVRHQGRFWDPSDNSVPRMWGYEEGWWCLWVWHRVEGFPLSVPGRELNHILHR